jgi:DNA-binding MarR family transcriptional regulator
MARERMLAVVLVGLMLVVIPTSAAEGENLSLDLTFDEVPTNGWYSSSDVVKVSASLVNNGDATTIDTDPSCGQFLRIFQNDFMIFDGSIACNAQSRGMNIASGSTTQFPQLTWDLFDDDGQLVSPGTYIVEYVIAGEDITNRMEINIQTPLSVPEGFELESTINSRGSGSPAILTLRALNTLGVEMDFTLENCLINIDGILYGECFDGATLAPHEIRLIRHIPLKLTAGSHQLEVALGDGLLSRTIEYTMESSTLGVSNGDLSQAIIDIDIDDADLSFGEDQVMSSTVRVSNLGSSDIILDFSDTCRGEMWVIDEAGRIVMDSRLVKTCDEMDLQYLIAPEQSRTFSQPDWAFTNLEGCLVSPGTLTLIAEIPEHGLFGMEEIELERAQGFACGQSSLSLSQIQSSNQDQLEVDLELTSLEATDLTWMSACGIEYIFSGPQGEITRSLSECGKSSSLNQRVEPSIQLDRIDFDMTGFEDGDYTIEITSNSEPKFSSVQTFSWPIEQIEAEETTTEVDDEENIVESRIIEGVWSSITTDDGMCWLLTSPDEGLTTLSNPSQSWSPQAGFQGKYLVKSSTKSTECSAFDASSFEIEQVISELAPAPVEEDEEIIQNEPIAEESTVLNPVVITVGAVVVSTGILSLLVAVIAGNETWRIPITSAGLWFLGLIGRTSETSDGRYQRGRLMGYLTANPGCHFRGLMAALEMSNGQITHHLKVLAEEEIIWRRADGRLVRFYPFTSNIHPGIDEEDLPLPPLSPDPNSLQGKILRLLDDDGQLEDYPTQAELANRLERSQQLVSHHLRTLQKFGLVEKRKIGLKNRYLLTKEATFLLESTEL